MQRYVIGEEMLRACLSVLRKTEKATMDFTQHGYSNTAELGDAILDVLENQADHNFAITRWSVQDVIGRASKDNLSVTVEEARAFLAYYGNSMVDAMFERGEDFIDNELEHFLEEEGGGA